MGQALFRYRLAVIIAFFAGAILIAYAHHKNPDALPLPSLATLITLHTAFAGSGVVCLVAFLFRASGEAKLGSVVYGQAAAPRVVTSGPFRFTRHPLYVGTWLFFVASTSPYLPPAVCAVLAVLFALGLRAIAVHEEAALAASLGDAWTRYAAAVPRFLGVPGAVDDDGVTTTATSWALAVLSNLGMLSLGLYRLLTAAELGFKGLAFLNVTCMTLWLVTVLVRRIVAK